MKQLLQYIVLALITAGVFMGANEITTAAPILDIPSINEIEDVSIKIDKNAKGFNGNVVGVGFSLLSTAKFIFQGVLLIFMVYIGIQMIMSMGNDEEELSKAKRQIWYSLVAILFINIPGSLFQAFQKDNYNNTISGGVNGAFTNNAGLSENIFINFQAFDTLANGFIEMMKIGLSGVAILIIVYTGIQIILSRGNEEVITEGKTKIAWSVGGLIFVGFIESWKYFAYQGNIKDGANLFDSAANIALFFAGPTAFFFICLAGYYYITANGDEERAKKGKSIIINTLLAILILLASYTFLKDLATL